MKTFYLVWNPKGQNPKALHSCESSARMEAERLAKLNPSEEFYVLEAKLVSRAVTVVTTRLSPTGSPTPSPETDDDEDTDDPFGDE